MLPIVREHDREAVELYFYSDAVTPDSTTDRFRQEADAWRNTASLGHDELAQQIRADQIDVLVDLTLHMAGSRLPTFALKPAPVQVTYGGYPSGTGLQAMDYRLTDPYLDPPGESDSWYVEKSIRLPDCFWCYAPDGPHPDANALPSHEAGLITFGCLNNFIKVNDRVLRLWAYVLAKVDRSRLLLLVPVGTARQRTLEVLQSHGIAADRIEFVAHQPRDAYLETYHRIDIGLDTLPYNGHTTSLDAFWMGVPVVTLVGQTAVGRAGWSQLSNLRLTDLAALNEMQFVEVASTLAANPTRLRDLRQHLRERMMRCPLTDPRRFARTLEAAYRQMWRQWSERASAEPSR
jgi:predicted O-linked N-acetylglucosamine transferase (SPINDLY family)